MTSSPLDGGHFSTQIPLHHSRTYTRSQCVQLGTSHLVAHYDVRPSTEPAHIYHQTSGNVLTVQEGYVHLSVGGCNKIWDFFFVILLFYLFIQILGVFIKHDGWTITNLNWLYRTPRLANHHASYSCTILILSGHNPDVLLLLAAVISIGASSCQPAISYRDGMLFVLLICLCIPLFHYSFPSVRVLSIPAYRTLYPARILLPLPFHIVFLSYTMSDNPLSIALHK